MPGVRDADGELELEPDEADELLALVEDLDDAQLRYLAALLRPLLEDVT